MEAIVSAILAASPQRFWGGLGLLGIATLGMLYLGFRQLHRARLIEDTPTSRIRSAAQGYVELEGRAVALGDPLYAPLSGKPCVWYQYRIDRRQAGLHGRKQRWVNLEQGVSEAIFGLEDGTGRCVIDPEGAEVYPNCELSWYGRESFPTHTPPGHSDFFGPYRYTERWIAPGDTLYALGWFRTLEGSCESDLEGAIKAQLKAWKADPQALRQRFDLNRDGQIDAKEWEIVRRQAAREALRAHLRQTPEEAVYLLSRPPRGEPFLLAGARQPNLIWGYRLRASGALLGFLLGGLGLAWALWQRLSQGSL